MIIRRIKAPLFITLFFISYCSSAQTGWQYLPDIGISTGSGRYEDVYFLDTLTGFAVCIGSIGPTPEQKNIFKTTDGGNTWIKVGPMGDGSDGLRSIEFLGDN